MAVILVSSILVFQEHIRTPIVLASESSVYGSGFEQGCNDARMSDLSKRFTNQPERNQSFTTDEFTRGYVAGFEICSNNQDLEFLGMKIAPDLGDITAIAALVATALIFWFGYVRTKKSEQIKVAGDQMDRISDMLLKRNEAINRDYPTPVHAAYVKWAYTRDVLEECERFGYMISAKIITDTITIEYYRPRIFDICKRMNNFAKDYAEVVWGESVEDFERYADSHIKILNGIITYWGRDWVSATNEVIDSLNTIRQEPSYFRE